MLFDEFDNDLAYARLTTDETARLAAREALRLRPILATERRLEDVNAAAKGSPFLTWRLPQIAIRDMRPDEARLFGDPVLAARGKRCRTPTSTGWCGWPAAFHLLPLAGRRCGNCGGVSVLQDRPTARLTPSNPI